MTVVVDPLVVAVNAHDLDAVADLIHEDYRSEQPAHPGRAFAGRAQTLSNWAAMFAGIRDFHAEICRLVQDGDTTWTEWRWSGTRTSSSARTCSNEVRQSSQTSCRRHMQSRARIPEGVTSAYGVEGVSGADAQTYTSPATIAERHGLPCRHAKSRSFCRVAGRPVLPRMDLAPQRRRTRSRCQRTIVSGVTSSRSAWRCAFGIRPTRVASRDRSAQFSFGRGGCRRCRTAS